MMQTLRRLSTTTVVLLVVVLLLIAGIVVAGRDSVHRVTAVFPRTVSLFEGSDVRIMGLRVGAVESITPTGTNVRVEMTYDAKYDLPADAKAVIMSPSVISDRFVQLTPSYTGGAKLADGAVIGEKDTGVPVELDRTFETTDQLLRALGPNGANRDGAVSDSLGVLADVLGGQGKNLRQTLADAADLTDTVAAGSDKITGTVRNLSGLSAELAEYDAAVGDFNEQLAGVAGTLADDKDDISALLGSLASSLGEIDTFVRDNRATLVRNVDSLVTVSDALEGERKALAQVVDIAPLAFTNLVNTYDPATGAVRTRANFAELLRNLDGVICNALESQAGEQVAGACSLLDQIISGLPLGDGIDIDGPAAPLAGGGTSQSQNGAGPPAGTSADPQEAADIVADIGAMLADLVPGGGAR